MKKFIAIFSFIVCSSVLLTACNTATPENYFDEAVLNCNMMMGFAGHGLQMEFDQPSVKLVEGTKDQTAPMTRKEIIDSKIKFIDDSYAKMKALKETADTKNMLQASASLYEYVLPVYKNEYVQLAKLYDDKVPKEQIDLLEKIINDKYFAGFQERFTALTNAGKPYATEHSIKVDWGN
jgi:hypothetical protein